MSADDPQETRYIAATKAGTPTARALAIHYPAQHGDGPAVCAVCYFWRPGLPDVVPESWPCPTVRELLP